MTSNVPAAARVVAAALVAVIVSSYLAVDIGGWDPVGPLRFLTIPFFAAIAIAAAAMLAVGQGGRWSRPIGPIWIALLAWLLVATIFAVDPLHAWIGTPDRHFGFATWLLLGGIWASARQLTARTAHWCIFAVAVAAAVCGVWSLLELVDVRLIDRTFDAGRIGGPFAQPAYLGAAIALAAPVSAGLAIDEWSNGARRLPTLAIALSGAAGGLLALVVSQSRAAWVGVAFAALAVGWRRRRDLGRFRRDPAVQAVAVCGALLTVIVLVVTPIGARVASLADVDGVIDGRTDEWTVALRAIGASPIIGHGPEGYRVVFGAHVDAAYAIEHGRTVITDRAHNGLLDVGTSAGIPGLLLYLGLVGAVLIAAWRSMLSDNAAEVGVAVGVAAYFLAQFFLFPVAEIDGAAWTLVGILGAKTAVESREPSRRARPFLVVAAGAAGVAAVVSAVAGVRDVAADRRVASATEALLVDDPTGALADADRARQLRPDSIRYHFIAARVAERVVLPHGYAAALERLDDGLVRAPRDPALTSEQAEAALQLARRTRSDDDLQRAVDLATTVATADPFSSQNQLRLGIVLGSTGDNAGAEDAFRRAAELGPTDGEPRFNLAVLLMQAGRFDEARTLAREAVAIEPNSRPDVEALVEEIDRRAGDPTDG